MELGKKAKLLRTSKGLTQDEIGRILGLKKSQISLLENGDRNFSIQQLQKLCNFYKIDISYFIMSETTESCLDLIEKARIIFKSKDISKESKEDLFRELMKIYLDSK